MQLTELEITKQFKDRDQSLRQIVKKHGWYLLGEGIEATVAEHPKRIYVLKIWPKGSNYEHFVEFVQENQSNPHVPRFSRYARAVPGTKYMYVRMEKLSHIPHTKLIKSYPAELIWIYAIGVKNNITSLSGNPWYFVSDQMDRFGIKVDANTDLETDLKEVWEKFGFPSPSWIEICENLIRAAQQHGISRFDLHGENVMTRGQTLVITDPWFL